MKVAIFPGETLEIEVGNADGIFTVTYGEEHLTIEADMPDTSGRMGVIYDENFGSVFEASQHIAAGASILDEEVISF